MASAPLLPCSKCGARYCPCGLNRRRIDDLRVDELEIVSKADLAKLREQVAEARAVADRFKTQMHAVDGKLQQALEFIAQLSKESDETIATVTSDRDLVVLQRDEAVKQLNASQALVEQLRGEKEHAYEQVASQRQRADKANDLLAVAARDLDKARDACAAYEKNRDQLEQSCMRWCARARAAEEKLKVPAEWHYVVGGESHPLRTKAPDEVIRLAAERDEARRTVELLINKPRVQHAALRIPGGLESAGQLMDRVGLRVVEIGQRIGYIEVVFAHDATKADVEAVRQALKAATP